MYWKGMRTTIRRYIKTCRSCQVNKKHSQKYGHLPLKLVITTPWKALCVDLIGPYTLKGKDGLSIDLGWEFRFSFPISETPIVSGIPIHVDILKIPVGQFFSNSAVEKSRKRNSGSKIWNS
jgi:hypothetical protein